MSRARRLLVAVTLITTATIGTFVASKQHASAESKLVRADAIPAEHGVGIARLPMEKATDIPAIAARAASRPASLPQASPLLPAITAFEQWLGKANVAAGRLSNGALAEGVSLARDRRIALKALIAADPREALAHAIPAATRRNLPAEITALLEQPVDAFGDFEVVSICDNQNPRTDRWTTIGSTRYATYTYGRRLATMTKNHLSVHGIAIDQALALSEEPYRAITSDSGNDSAVEAQVGTVVLSFPTLADRDVWAQDIATAEQTADPNALLTAPKAAAVTAGWTVGQKSVLWIRAEFPDDAGSPATDDQINAAMTGVSSFYQDVSHNTCSFQTTILPGTVKLTTTKAAYSADPTSYISLRTDAVQLARNYDAANGATGQYNPDKYDRYIVLFKNVSGYSWAGISAVGGTGCCLNGAINTALAAHELGHNHGLRHSHGWAPTTSSPIDIGIHMEYGDAFDDMGAGQNNTTEGHFNTIQKYNLGYLTDTSVQTISQSGVYRIFRHDDRNASGIQALKIASKWTGTNYWLEYRHAAPYAAFTAPYVGTPELPRLQNGIEIHWDHGPSFTSGPGTYLLDMTPTTTSGVPTPTDYSMPNHLLDDSALALGESFNDPGISLTVTPINVGGTAPNEWIDVYISLGSTASNHAPSVSAAMTSSSATVRTDVTFVANATDADGDTVYYHWDFGDGTITPATGTVTHQWLKGGTYTVQCTALDGKGGQSTTTIPVTVADPMQTWVPRANGLTTHYFYDVLFDGAQFVAVGSYVAATSPDGVSWAVATGMTSTNYNYSIARGAGRYVAVGATSATSSAASISTSTDGKSWVDATPTGVSALYSVVYANGLFVAVGLNGTIVTSTDGVNWTTATSGVGVTLNTVRYGGGKFVIAGNTATYLSSTDGINWQNNSVSGETSSAYGLAYYRNGWISITGSYPAADPSKRVVFTSPDGTTWTKSYINANSPMSDPIVMANSSLLIGVSRANDGRVFISQDGVNWTDEQVVAVPSGASMYLESAAEGNGTLVVVGVSSQIYTPTGAPFVVAQPAPQSVNSGQSVTWNAQAYGTGPFTYQWKKNGTAISGATEATFSLYDTASGDAGNYSVTITNAAGSYTTNQAVLTVNSVQHPTGPAAWISNLSVRANMSAGQTMIVGFTVADGSEDILVRAAGPWLATTFPQWFSPTSVMADPRLAYYPNGATAAAANNDDWDSGLYMAFTAVGASPFVLGSPDAAFVQTLTGGNNTVWVQGTGGGYVLLEGYGLAKSGAPRLVNISARNHVGTGADILIAGFVLKGSGTKKLLIRGIGPRLNEIWGIPGVLADPMLEIYDAANNKIAENNDWDASLAPTFNTVGAYQFTPGSKDAAMIVNLPASGAGTAYTAQVKGADGGTGEAVVEVYDVP